jgi:hypothetical protein
MPSIHVPICKFEAETAVFPQTINSPFFYFLFLNRVFYHIWLKFIHFRPPHPPFRVFKQKTALLPL